MSYNGQYITNAEVSILDIKRAVGSLRNSISELCQSSRIDKWSIRKPLRRSFIEDATTEDERMYDDAAMPSEYYGLTMPDEQMTAQGAVGDSTSYQYLKPRGDEFGEPFRFGDWRLYCPYAKSPMAGVMGKKSCNTFVSSSHPFYFALTKTASANCIGLVGFPTKKTQSTIRVTLGDCYLAMVIKVGSSYTYRTSQYKISYPGVDTVVFSTAELPSVSVVTQAEYYLVAALLKKFTGDSEPSGQRFFALPFDSNHPNGSVLTIDPLMPVTISAQRVAHYMPGIFADGLDITIYEPQRPTSETPDTYFEIPASNTTIHIGFAITSRSSQSFYLTLSQVQIQLAPSSDKSNPTGWIIPQEMWAADSVSATMTEISTLSSLTIDAGQTKYVFFRMPSDFGRMVNGTVQSTIGNATVKGAQIQLKVNNAIMDFSNYQLNIKYGEGDQT